MSSGKRVVLGISGASGAPLAMAVAERLHRIDGIELHLIVSRAARLTLQTEVGAHALGKLERLATEVHAIGNLGASLASGSFRTQGMVVAPCSTRTLAAIATGMSDNLLVRAAEVHLKERRRLVWLARESPLHLGHLRAMSAVTEMGAIVAPPVPLFYLACKDVREMVGEMAARAIDLLDLGVPQQGSEWHGPPSNDA